MTEHGWVEHSNVIWLIIIRHRTQPHQPEACWFHLHLCKLAWTDGEMMLERGREERTRREFLWFTVASGLCNQHAKLLMSKSTTRTQTVYTYSTQIHIHKHVHANTSTHTANSWHMSSIHVKVGYKAHPE